MRLESLLQQLHASSSSSGKEQIKAACSDLEKIRKLKKEAEFLEASFRAKAASLQEVFRCYFQTFPFTQLGFDIQVLMSLSLLDLNMKTKDR